MPSSVCYKQIGHLLVTGGRIVHGVLSNRGTVVYICIYVYIYICTGLRKQFCISRGSELVCLLQLVLSESIQHVATVRLAGVVWRCDGRGFC